MKPENFLKACQIISENHSNEIFINWVRPGGVVEVGAKNPTIHIIDCTGSTVDKLKNAGFSLSMDGGKLSVQDYAI